MGPGHGADWGLMRPGQLCFRGLTFSRCPSVRAGQASAVLIRKELRCCPTISGSLSVVGRTRATGDPKALRFGQRPEGRPGGVCLCIETKGPLCPSTVLRMKRGRESAVQGPFQFYLDFGIPPRPQGRGGMAEGLAMSLVFTRVVCVRVCVCVKSLSRAPRNVLYCMPALCQQRHLKKKKITHIYLSP